MKKRFLSLALIAAVATFQACDKESEDALVQSSDTNTSTVDNTTTTTPESNKVKMTFSAGHYNGTSKTAIMDGLSLGFSAGDKINVFDGYDRAYPTCDVVEGTKATCNFDIDADPDATDFYALYAQDYWDDNDAERSYPIIPTSQTAVEGSFDPKGHVMVAHSDIADKSFMFKTVNAFLKFTAPKDLKSVILTGNKGEAIAGCITVNGYSDFTISDGLFGYYSVILSGDIKQGKDYYISYVPKNFEDGVSLTLVDKDDNMATYKTRPFTAESNKVDKISAEKLNTATPVSPAKISSEGLNVYLKNSTIAAVKVELSDYDADKVRTALIDNPSKIVSIVLPGSETEIPDYAFLVCANLASIEMPGVTSIGNCAFQDCTILELTSLPDKLTSIGNKAFEFCTSLALTSLPDGVTSIGIYAFNGCKSLNEITIPAKVTSIGNDAFYSCESLATITILGTPEIGDASEKDDFRNCPDGTVINITTELYDLYPDYWNYWKDYDFTIIVGGEKK